MTGDAKDAATSSFIWVLGVSSTCRVAVLNGLQVSTGSDSRTERLGVALLVIGGVLAGVGFFVVVLSTWIAVRTFFEHYNDLYGTSIKTPYPWEGDLYRNGLGWEPGWFAIVMRPTNDPMLRLLRSRVLRRAAGFGLLLLFCTGISILASLMGVE